MKKECVSGENMIFLCIGEIEDTKFAICGNTVFRKKLFLIPKRSFPIVENDFSDNCTWMILANKGPSSPPVLILCTQNIFLLNIWFSIYIWLEGENVLITKNNYLACLILIFLNVN